MMYILIPVIYDSVCTDISFWNLLPLGNYVLRVLMFDIFVDWLKTQNFVPTNISYMHYRT